MRRRDDKTERLPGGPERIDGLVEQVRSVGLPATARVTGPRHPLLAEIDRAQLVLLAYKFHLVTPRRSI